LSDTKIVEFVLKIDTWYLSRESRKKTRYWFKKSAYI